MPWRDTEGIEVAGMCHPRVLGQAVTEATQALAPSKLVYCLFTEVTVTGCPQGVTCRAGGHWGHPGVVQGTLGTGPWVHWALGMWEHPRVLWGAGGTQGCCGALWGTGCHPKGPPAPQGVQVSPKGAMGHRGHPVVPLGSVGFTVAP